jgi:predicted metal-dependent enzyme (double-stranded beta helix superfamily)
MKLNRRRVLAATAGVAALGMVAAASFASPGSGIVSTNLVAKADLEQAVHLNSDRIKFQTKGPTDVRVQTLTFAPGAITGWHHHPGFVLVAVESGEVTVFDSDCNAKAYGPSSANGSAFTESGDEPLEVRNMTAAPARVYATFVAPSLDAGVFRLEDEVQPCS